MLSTLYTLALMFGLFSPICEECTRVPMNLQWYKISSWAVLWHKEASSCFFYGDFNWLSIVQFAFLLESISLIWRCRNNSQMKLPKMVEGRISLTLVK